MAPLSASELSLEAILKSFNPIKLEEMDSVKLMNRTDTKYIFNVNMLYEILYRAKTAYRVLEINQARNFQYVTTYFDTPSFNMYNEHQNGKLNRYKIRQRRYDQTGVEFLEVKFKNNKGKTFKSRIENNKDEVFNDAADIFLQKKTPYGCNQLQQALQNNFIRITLVDNNKTERATLDYNLSFTNSSCSKAIPHLGIAEIKQDAQSGISPLIKILREMSIRPGGVSKYCLGAAFLYDDLKRNRLKPQILKIQNL